MGRCWFMKTCWDKEKYKYLMAKKRNAGLAVSLQTSRDGKPYLMPLRGEFIIVCFKKMFCIPALGHSGPRKTSSVASVLCWAT